MRLEKIILNGFKSFADKTEFTFNQQITAIVGPNGCGKSNVVDALKWVLGEQSKKSLRSNQMADVIFSGSSSRKSSGMAEVSLHFSQAAGLGIDTDELAITRRLYRSGDSEYLINNKTCRLKDVKELFMDTGVGVKAYSIIEQGQISQLLTASKVDRRAIFEEAAGISKYKSQKKEALRKLERTEQNLLRLADIVAEVQKQLRSIKLQAGKARNYLQHSQRLKELQVSFSLAQYHQLKSDTDTNTGKLEELQNQFADITAEVARKDALLSSLSAEIVEQENQINQCENMLVSINGKIEQKQQRIEFLRSKITELAQRTQEQKQQSQELSQKLLEFDGLLEKCQADSKEIDLVIAEKTSQLQELQAKIQTANSDCAKLENELSDEKSGIIDIVRRTAQLHNEIQSVSVYRNNLHGQKNRLNDKISQSSQQLEAMLADKLQNQNRLDEINKVIAELQTRLEDKRQQIKQIDADVASTNEKLARAREQRSALVSETKVLEDMENKHEGVDKAVKEILALAKESDRNFVGGIVADVISADADYAIAIEAALEGRTDAILISDTAALLADEQLLGRSKGRVKFICTDKIKPQSEPLEISGYKRAVEFVSFAPEYSDLVNDMLASVIVVDTIEQALELSAACQQGCSFVTKAGRMLSDGGIISTGPIGKSAGLISRKSRLAQLHSELEAVAAQIEKFEAQLASDVRENEHLERLCKDFRTSVYEANTEKTNTVSDLNVVEQNIKRLTEEKPILAREIENLESQIAETVETECSSKQTLAELEEVNAQRTKRIDELESELSQKKAKLNDSTAALTDMKVSLGQATEQQKAIAQRTESLKNQSQSARNIQASAQQTIAACSRQSEESEQEIIKAESEISELLSNKETTGNQKNSLGQKIELMLNERIETEESLKTARAKEDELNEQIHKVEMILSQLEVKLSDLISRVSEELQMDLVEKYEDYSGEQMDWDAVRQEINELRQKIERLGNVNVDAIEQQDELEKRNEFLSGQIEDLEKSKQQLSQLINRLNTESVDKFAMTFEKVRGNFQEVFRKLFGGGRADIILEEPDDILESGIEVIARPPGKETRSISLLSGGEKTMTAIALLFAIFQTKPSPFCFLDEVDAALDEANNERFNLIVQEFRKDSQFVVITHAKRTMSIADMLFGVTMQQKGISKKISVKFDSYESPESKAESETDAAVA